MASMLERVREMLEFPGVVKKSAAAAMGVSASAVSNILNGKRDISAAEFAALESYFRSFRGAGLEEPAAAYGAASFLSPLYPARARAGAEWSIDLAADPADRALAPAPIRGRAEVYGFRAPDDTAWPRFKIGEIVWATPGDSASPGDDVFIIAAAGTAKSLTGRLAELATADGATLRCRAFSSGRIESFRKGEKAILKIAARDR